MAGRSHKKGAVSARSGDTQALEPSTDYHIYELQSASVSSKLDPNSVTPSLLATSHRKGRREVDDEGWIEPVVKLSVCQ